MSWFEKLRGRRGESTPADELKHLRRVLGRQRRVLPDTLSERIEALLKDYDTMSEEDREDEVRALTAQVEEYKQARSGTLVETDERGASEEPGWTERKRRARSALRERAEQAVDRTIEQLKKMKGAVAEMARKMSPKTRKRLIELAMQGAKTVKESPSLVRSWLKYLRELPSRWDEGPQWGLDGRDASGAAFDAIVSGDRISYVAFINEEYGGKFDEKLINKMLSAPRLWGWAYMRKLLVGTAAAGGGSAGMFASVAVFGAGAPITVPSALGMLAGVAGLQVARNIFGLSRSDRHWELAAEIHGLRYDLREEHRKDSRLPPDIVALHQRVTNWPFLTQVTFLSSVIGLPAGFFLLGAGTMSMAPAALMVLVGLVGLRTVRNIFASG